MDLSGVHESVVTGVLARLDTRSKCVLICTCRALHDILRRPEHWRVVAFEDAAEQQGLSAAHLVSVLARSRRKVEVLRLARSPEAREAEKRQRYAAGVRHHQSVPYTRGLRALALTAMLPALTSLSIDERASCLGGMTNDLARALATHCPALESLEVHYERYSLPSELFSDEGLICLSERCRRLGSLTLHNCDGLSDRSLYALAANCRQLQELALSGYNENISDAGLCILFEALGPTLRRVRLGSRLLKVTDAAADTLAARCSGLTSLKMTRRMTGPALGRLAAACPCLQDLDCRRCGGVAPAHVAALLAGCPRLARLALPPALELAPLLAQLPRSCRVDLSEEQHMQQLLLL